MGQPERQISFDLRELMVAATAADPATFGPIDDYYLTGFGFGWEIVGHYDFSSEIFRVSVAGWPKTIMDSEVYNDQVYKIYNSFPPDDQWSPGMRRAHWTKWGAEEGWPASQTFDVKIYMDRWGNPADPGSGSYYNFMPQCYNGDGSRNYPCAIVDYVWNGRPDHPGHW